MNIEDIAMIVALQSVQTVVSEKSTTKAGKIHVLVSMAATLYDSIGSNHEMPITTYLVVLAATGIPEKLVEEMIDVLVSTNLVTVVDDKLVLVGERVDDKELMMRIVTGMVAYRKPNE